MAFTMGQIVCKLQQVKATPASQNQKSVISAAQIVAIGYCCDWPETSTVILTVTCRPIFIKIWDIRVSGQVGFVIKCLTPADLSHYITLGPKIPAGLAAKPEDFNRQSTSGTL